MIGIKNLFTLNSRKSLGNNLKNKILVTNIVNNNIFKSYAELFRKRDSRQTVIRKIIYQNYTLNCMFRITNENYVNIIFFQYH